MDDSVSFLKEQASKRCRAEEYQETQIEKIKTKYLGEPHLSDEGIEAIRKFYSLKPSREIVYRLLDEIKNHRKENKELSDKIADNILPKK